MRDVQPGRYGVVDLRPTGVGRIVAAAIRLGTRSPWCHAFIVMPGGQVIEATPRGARWGSLERYFNEPSVAFNDLEPFSAEQLQVTCRCARGMLGVRYSFLDIFALFCASISLGRPFRKRLARSDRMICSQLVDEAYRRAGVHLFNDGRLPQDVTPADLGLRLATRPWERV